MSSARFSSIPKKKGHPQSSRGVFAVGKIATVWTTEKNLRFSQKVTFGNGPENIRMLSELYKSGFLVIEN